MQKREPVAVLLLPFITCGIYSWYWLVKTKGELNRENHDEPRIPTAWIWLIPFVGTIWWQWKYGEAVEKYTRGKCSQVVAFILLFLLGMIGMAIIQDYLNKAKTARHHAKPHAETE